jgi:hypothetical protein
MARSDPHHGNRVLWRRAVGQQGTPRRVRRRGRHDRGSRPELLNGSPHWARPARSLHA